MDDDLAGLMSQLSLITATSHSELRTQFAAVLKITEDEAGFYLDSASGNIEIACNLFLEMRESENGGMMSSPPGSPPLSPGFIVEEVFEEAFERFLSAHPTATPEQIEAFRTSLMFGRGGLSGPPPPSGFLGIPSRPTVSGPGFGAAPAGFGGMSGFGMAPPLPGGGPFGFAPAAAHPQSLPFAMGPGFAGQQPQYFNGGMHGGVPMAAPGAGAAPFFGGQFPPSHAPSRDDGGLQDD